MKSRTILALALWSALTHISIASQALFSSGLYAFDSKEASNEGRGGGQHYKLAHPVRKVAVIGAGVGGIIAHRELSGSGFAVHVYERDNVPGGNWHYTDQAPVDAPIPNEDVSTGDYVPTFPPDGTELPYVEVYPRGKGTRELKREHRAPKPVWKTLTSNAPAPYQQIREFPWPVGTPWALPHKKIQRYLRAFASWHALNVNDQNPNVFYNTRVEKVEKRFDEEGKKAGWTLTLKELIETADGNVQATWWKEDYDAVVVATGRYNAPNIPSIPGLKEWNEKFPGRISHTRQYRYPDEYKNQTILIVGASTSGSEIARDIIRDAKAVYVSIRDSKSPIATFPKAIFAGRVPLNATILPEIQRIVPESNEFSDGKIELINGTVLSGFDKVISATGYRYSYPFIPQYHNSSLGPKDHADRKGVQPIVTDGTHLRSLYLDSFYIPDPTIVFLNMNYGMQSFTYAEYLSLAAAKVWSGKADLPNEKKLWQWYRAEYKRRKGYGRHYLYLGSEGTKERIRFFVGWLNAAAVKYGGRQIDGASKANEEIASVWFQARFSGLRPIDPGNSSISSSQAKPGSEFWSVDSFDETERAEYSAEDYVFNDYW